MLTASPRDAAGRPDHAGRAAPPVGRGRLAVAAYVDHVMDAQRLIAEDVLGITSGRRGSWRRAVSIQADVEQRWPQDLQCDDAAGAHCGRYVTPGSASAPVLAAFRTLVRFLVDRAVVPPSAGSAPVANDAARIQFTRL